MRKYLIALLFLALPAFAQYGPPTNPGSNSTVGFWASGKTSNLAASTSTVNIALSIAGPAQVQVFNSTTGVAFIACGNSSVTASVGSNSTSTADYPVAPGSIVVISPQAGSVNCAAVLSTSSGTVYFTPGVGL